MDDLTPNMGLWWYFFAEIFGHFRAFFLFVFHVQPALLLLPLTMRMRSHALSLVLATCILVALFKVWALFGLCRCPLAVALTFGPAWLFHSHTHAPQTWACV